MIRVKNEGNVMDPDINVSLTNRKFTIKANNRGGMYPRGVFRAELTSFFNIWIIMIISQYV
jgi:hypothetical protein